MQSSIVDNGDGTGSVTVLLDGQIHVALSDHARYKEIVEGALAKDTSVIDLFRPSLAIAERFYGLSDRVSVANDRIYFDGDEVDNSLTQAILRFLDNDEPNWQPLVNFMEKVATNPNQHSRDQLFSWINNRPFTITDDGDIVMYKGLTSDMMSVHSGRAVVDGEPVEGQIPNPIGSEVEMPRSSVAHDPSTGCSTGLHAATHDFADGFGSVVVAILVNPRDVVSVPTHSNAEKVRVCRYIVRSIVKSQTDSLVLDEDDDEDWDF